MRLASNSIYWIAGLIIVVVVLAVNIGGSKTQLAGPGSLTGRQAPSFPADTLSGGTSSLSAYRGKVVVMNLWASWCPPCRAEMPDLQRLYASYAGRNVVVLGVDEGESAQRAGAFAQSLAIRYPILIDKQQQYGRVYAALGLPTTIIIDQRGTVVRGFDGPLAYQQMEGAITPLLGKRS